MAPLNLQGLNLVHSASPAPQDNHDLLATSPFPDFSAHLDLWTNLAFESDEPLARNKGKRKSVDESDEDTAAPSPLGLPTHDGHENVVHPTSTTITHSDAHAPQLDLNALLAGFGIDPMSLPQFMPTPAENVAAPSLAQLLALHNAQGGTYSVPPPPPVVLAQPSQPATKRARTSKSLESTETFDPVSPVSATGEETQGDLTNPLSAAEDKRRRNTAASARFRLKKKEREAALERRAKELEERVVELERECEGLRRENGWLKGLVVGVTGAGAK
ncbi:hypothetical protein BDR04DRAFT_1111691 [Suillus decipiens]|nr:hypothetical protein BDR04DRAFT_1111691 [Suillus decipiens]